MSRKASPEVFLLDKVNPIPHCATHMLGTRKKIVMHSDDDLWREK